MYPLTRPADAGGLAEESEPMSIHPPPLTFLGTLPARLARGVGPALHWLKRELDAARRDNLDAQFMATARGSRYQRSDWIGR
jgi:hypothetical protein